MFYYSMHNLLFPNEPHYRLFCIGRCVGQREQQIPVAATLLQSMQQGIDRKLLAPIFAVEENHRTLMTECAVVVLRCILENLLHHTRSTAPGTINGNRAS